MRALSISAAWDETKAILTRDGKLFVSVTLALVAFPTLIAGLVNPKGTMVDAAAPLWISVVAFLASLIALAGQLALIRLALGPSTTVGSAIGHGLKRMPIYLLSAIIIVLALLLCAVPFALGLQAMGVPLGVRAAQQPVAGPLLIGSLLYLLLILFVVVRMMMTAPVASAESVGPIAIITRSWRLTSGNFWRLLGFLIAFVIGALVLSIGVEAALGAVAGIMLGPIEPMSVSAVIVALVHALLNSALTVLFAVMVARIYAQLAGAGAAEASVPTTGI